MSGAGSGAAAGASFGPWGAAIGGVGGGLLGGLFGGKSKSSGTPLLRGATVDQANQTYAAMQGLTGRQTNVADFLSGRMGDATPIDFSAANATLGTGQDLLSQLMAQGRGEGPNPALEQLRQTTAENINQATGMAASARGINPALAARMAVNASAGANQGAAGQAAIMSAQQQLAARAQAAGLVGQQAGQQAGMAQAQAGQQAQNIQQLMQQLETMGGQNLSQQQILQQALAAYNATSAQQALGQGQLNQKMAGSLFQGAGAGLGALASMLGKGGGGGAPGGGVTAGGTLPGIQAPQMIPMGATGGEITRAGFRGDGDVARAILARRGRKMSAGGEARAARPRSDKDVARAILFGKGGKVPRLAEGGKADAPGRSKGLMDALSEWWTSRSEPASREVAEQVDRKLPEAVGASKTIQRHRADLDAAYAAAEGKARGGAVGEPSREKAIAAQILMQRSLRGRGYARGGLAPEAPPRASAQAPLPIPDPGPDAPTSFVGQLFQGAPRERASFARGGAANPPFLSLGVPQVVPGRASVPEGVDSESADRVPAWLSPGEIVIPRSAAQAADAPEQARDFVAHLVKSRSRKGGYARVVEARRRAGGR